MAELLLGAHGACFCEQCRAFLFYMVKSKGDHISLLQTAKGGEEGLLRIFCGCPKPAKCAILLRKTRQEKKKPQ